MKTRCCGIRPWIIHPGRICVALCVFSLIGWAQGVIRAQVVTVIPDQNAIDIAPNTTISATFDDGMDPATINDTTFLVFGELSGMHTGTITYNNITNTATLDPNIDFITGEIITAYLTNAIQDTLGGAFNGFAWNFTIMVQSGTGHFKPAHYYGANDGPHGIMTAYLNSDQNLDLIVTNGITDDFSVLLGIGDGSFQTPSNTGTGPQPEAVACGDLNCDQYIDWIIACRGDNQVYCYLNDGNGTGMLTDQIQAASNPLSLYCADLSGDGICDIATANQGANNMSIFIGNGDGTFQSAVNYGVGPSPGCIDGGDLDMDGFYDLVIAGSGNNRVFVFLNNGDGTFSSAGNISTGTGSFGVTLASLDSVDRYLDFSTANYGTNSVSVALGDGIGGFSSSILYTILNGPRYCVSGDLDNDADIDIITSNPTHDSISIAVNDGAGQLNQYDGFYAGDSAMQACIGDFNNDGGMDIAVSCYASDSVAILLNATDTIAPYIVSTVPDSGDSNIALNSSIYITFSEAMDTMSIDTSSFYISGSIVPAYGFSVSYDTLTFIAILDPDSLFGIQETIYVDVSQVVADTSGNQMGTPYTFYFTTATTADTLGPLVTAMNLYPDTSQGATYCTITGTISDSTTGMSVITAAEVFIDSTGQNGTGMQCQPVDSMWDEILEEVILVHDISSLPLGDHWVFLHGKDGSLWGPFDSLCLVVTPDDDTLGPTFSDFQPDTVPDTSPFYISCVITDPSGVYDDSTGSSGQGVYMLWDNDGEIVITSYEAQLSQVAGDTFQTDTQIPQQNTNANFVYEVYAYDNDFEFNEPEDRTQGQSGLQTIIVIDGQGPVTSNVQISPPAPPAGITEVVVYATVSDSTTGSSLIIGAETFLDSIGASGTGFPMMATDGSFDEVLETVFDTVPVSGWAAGDTHVFYVHGQDENSNWGNHDSIVVVVTGIIDTIPPDIAITIPDSGQYGVAVDTWIYVTFTEPVDPLTVTPDKILIEGDIQGVYSFWMSYDEVDSTLSINPTGNFAADESVNVFIAAGIQDLVGNTMPTGYWWWFRTGGGDTLGPDFQLSYDPATVYIGDSVIITAISSETLHPDSAFICTVTTTQGTSYALTFAPDIAGYTTVLSTIGFSPGECYVSVIGYDVSSNLGVTYDTFSIGRQGDFLPEDMVYGWPNPVRTDSVNIHFYVNANADITIDIFTIAGKKVATLTGRGDGGRPPHLMTSNAIVWDVTEIASDVYIFKLTAVSDIDGEEQSVIKKLVVVK